MQVVRGCKLQPPPLLPHRRRSRLPRGCRAVVAVCRRTNASLGQRGGYPYMYAVLMKAPSLSFASINYGYPIAIAPHLPGAAAQRWRRRPAAAAARRRRLNF